MTSSSTELNNEYRVTLDGAAIVCAHVANSSRPILHAERDEPTMPEDTGWQFLCDAEEPEDVKEAQVWALSEVLEVEPSLAGFINYPPGISVFRVNQNSPWTIVGNER